MPRLLPSPSHPHSPVPNHLIIVCCHAIYLANAANDTLESNWLLQPFQLGETPTFIQHIHAGVQALAQDDNSVLFFSGGATRAETRTTEARGYLDVLRVYRAWALLGDAAVADRVYCEERAMDSFQNVVFTLTAFYARYRTWPAQITVISHEFKRERFLDLHFPAIGWRADRVTFVGIDPGYMVGGGEAGGNSERALGVREGERSKGLGLWRMDSRGVGEVLRRKRAERNVSGTGMGLFEDEWLRDLSGVRWEVVNGCEVLKEGRQPWS